MIYDYNAGINAPKLRLDDSFSLAELRNYAIRAGFKGVMKYNNKDVILHDIYEHINLVRDGQKVPDDRVKRYTRVTAVARDLSDIGEIYGFNNKADLYGYSTVTGLFHRDCIDGYISARFTPGSDDSFVIEPLIKKYGLEDGDMVSGRYFYYAPRDQYVLADVVGINGMPIEVFRRAGEAVTVPAERPIKVWGRTFLNAVAALAPFKTGESLLVTHPTGFDAGDLADALTAAAAGSVSKPEILRIDVGMPEAGGADAMRLDLDPTFFSEAFRVAANRARTLRNYGRNVVLVLTNASVAALGRELIGLYSALTAASCAVAGSVTVIVTLDAGALSAAELAAARLAATAELAVTEDETGAFYPDPVHSRYKGRLLTAHQAAIASFRRFAAREGNAAAADRLTAATCLDAFIDGEAGA